MEKIKIKITLKKIFFWFYVVIIITCISALFCDTLFLYKNFYQTIAQSKEIVILKEKVAVETINIKKFNAIIEKIEQKTAQRELDEINNPFE